jgi:hypothetical protein
MRRSLGIISGAFALRNRLFALITSDFFLRYQAEPGTQNRRLSKLCLVLWVSKVIMAVIAALSRVPLLNFSSTVSSDSQ